MKEELAKLKTDSRPHKVSLPVCQHRFFSQSTDIRAPPPSFSSTQEKFKQVASQWAKSPKNPKNKK